MKYECNNQIVMVIREMYLSKIWPFIGKDIIKVLTGIRRGGKSVLLEQIRDEINNPNTVFINFEDLGNQHLCEYNALHEFICEKIGNSTELFYLFFDEIQEVQSTYITGRYVSFVVYPFSFLEFTSISSDFTFNDYLKYGGMPFLSNLYFEPDISREILHGRSWFTGGGCGVKPAKF